MMSSILLLLATLASPDAGEAKRRLEARVAVDLRHATVEDVIETLRPATGLSFVLHPRVPAKADVTIRLRNVPVKAVLKRVLDPRNLKAVWRDGAILIAPRTQAVSRVVVRTYDVTALQVKKEDFPGPYIELRPQTGAHGIT